jgi:dTDP-4-amino-4,6-dideoxygalactose transaminase
VLQGKYLAELEHKIAKKYKRKYAVGVGSATDGLYFAMKAIGLGKGSKIVSPAFSYVATAGAIRRLGANIHFIDTDNQGNIDDWEMAESPDAVLYVNMFGNLADYNRLRKYCDKHKIPLIEDAAQSQGAMYGRTPSGALGDVSVFSFDPMKNMPSFGGGGMVLTDKKEVNDSVLSLRRHGLTGNDIYGYNSLISEDHANQLLLILAKFNKLQTMREKIAKRYKKNLPELSFMESRPKTQSSNHKLVVLFDKRDELKQYLQDNGIETRVHYAKTLDSDSSRYPNAESICSRALSLPIYPHLRLDEVDYICDRIKEFIYV